jgi:hypothetical protein
MRRPWELSTYWELTFDNFHVHEGRPPVPVAFLSLFQEADRRVLKKFPQEYSHLYVAPRDVILRRLDIMGFSARAAAEAFEVWRNETISRGRQGDLKMYSFKQWSSRVPRLFGGKSLAAEVEAFTRGLFFDARDQRAAVRALLEACDNVKLVELDISSIASDGLTGENARVCDLARKSSALTRPALEPVVILGEGRSDIRILRSSLKSLYPDLTNYFSFFDYDEHKVEGSASQLLKLLKAFASARISSRVVALFDNDTAGRESLNSALRLPPNITALKLPDIALAKAYPTIGPQGEHVMDVNGRAASIELYLGKHNLTCPKGNLIPVKWGGYQGAIEGKVDIVKRFESDLKSKETPDQAQAAYPELVAVWQHIFAAIRV